IFGRQFYTAWYKVAEFAELAGSFYQAGAKAIDMGSAEYSRNQVYITFGHQLAAVRQPQHRPVNALLVALQAPGKRFSREAVGALDGLLEIIGEPVFVIPFVAARFIAAGRIVDELHAQTGTQHRLGTQHVDQ